jgi:hypothetical protein
MVAVDLILLKPSFLVLMGITQYGGKKVCEKYFDLYDVEHETWANFATMHFTRNVALWLQTYEAKHDIDNWEELCVAIHSKFGKDKHHRYLEALEHCK